MKLFKWNKNKTIMNRTKMAFLLQLSKVDTSFQWRWCDLQSESHELICRCTKTRIFWQWTNTHSHNQKFTLFHIFLRAHSNGKINKTKKKLRQAMATTINFELERKTFTRAHRKRRGKLANARENECKHCWKRSRKWMIHRQEWFFSLSKNTNLPFWFDC